jgi:ribosomal peptide maturation radical SAM protein 1
VRNEKTFAFLRYCLQAVEWQRFSLIGFSVTFQQMLATIAFARVLKEAWPQIPIILGGAAFEDDIAAEIYKGCPFVDYIHCGDGDKSFPEMAQRLFRRESPAGVPGLMWRDGENIHYGGRAPFLTDLDATPVPDFDEYFHARRESGYQSYVGHRKVMLPIETARGCWWGEKHHCAFCGLNRAGLKFRSKSADRVVEMLDALATRYGQFSFDAIDNIMAPDYADGLFGRLVQLQTDFQLHYEVRPGISRQRLRKMKRGGLKSVQPGVESLSTHVLQLMNKRILGVHNIEFMKWCAYYNVTNLYNILYGFSGETVEDYELQCQLIPRIVHLEPPYSLTRARADRGSPMFTNPEKHGVKNLSPEPCYAFLYPADRFDLRKVSYYFQREQSDGLEKRIYLQLRAQIDEWRRRWLGAKRPILRYLRTTKTIQIEDSRRETPCYWRYDERQSQLYTFCNNARRPGLIFEHFGGGWVQAVLDELVARELMLYLDGYYLSLALPVNYSDE